MSNRLLNHSISLGQAHPTASGVRAPHWWKSRLCGDRLWEKQASGGCSALGVYRRPYLSLREMIFGEDECKVEEARLGTMLQPVAKKVNGRFISPWSSQTEKKATDVVKYLLTRKQLKLDLKVDSIELIKPSRVDRVKCKGTEKPHCTWIGHATCLYQAEGAFFLTDPLWSERCSPVSFTGPKRYMDPPIEIEDLKIDVVLLSHTHFDHLDQKSAERIGNRALW
jgi:hypothetical protein